MDLNFEAPDASDEDSERTGLRVRDSSKDHLVLEDSKADPS